MPRESDFTIMTPRLALYAPSLEEISALIRDERGALQARISATLPPEWPAPHLKAALPSIAEEMAQELGDMRWVWLIIERASAVFVGDIGYHGPLRAGATVEIGYILLPQAQGQGYATEATAALLRWTFAHTAVAQVIAQIDPQNAGSIRVATKVGMEARPPVSPEYLCFGISRPLALTDPLER
jgi:RimJ/RimL family protein N-acetyltransferase